MNAPLTKTICVSDYGYRSLMALDLIDSGRVQRIYNGIQTAVPGDPAALARTFRERYGIPAGRRLVVQVSWIIPQKGIGDLLGHGAIADTIEDAVGESGDVLG